MSVHKEERKHGVRYRCKYRDANGTQHSRSFDLKKDADAFDLESRRAKQRGGLGPSAGNCTFEQFVETWARLHVQPNLAKKTQQMYATAYDCHIGPYIGRVKLRDFNVLGAVEFQASLATRTKPAMAQKAMTVLSGILTKAVQWGYLEINPVRQIAKPKAKPKRAPVALSPSQVEQICDWFRKHHRPHEAVMVALMAYSGLRPGEARALTWADIGQSTIHVWKAISSDEVASTKTGATRSVMLLPPLRSDLRAMRMLRGRPDDSEYVFPGKAGDPMIDEEWKRWRSRWFTRATRELQIPTSRPYDLRHSFASLLLQGGTPSTQVAEQMGHSVQVLHDNYAHVIGDFRGCGFIDPETAINQARGRDVPQKFRAALVAVKADGPIALRNGKPDSGLEPLTPSLPWRCSTN